MASRRRDSRGRGRLMEGGSEVFDGFDYPEAKPVSYYQHGLYHFDCEDSFWPDRASALVKLYAKVGIHRYNLLEGTKWKFDSIKSFNMGLNSGATSYYLTVAAYEPPSGVQNVFHVRVNENNLGLLDLTCYIARPRRIVTNAPPTTERMSSHCFQLSTSHKCKLPHWPSSELDFNDSNRFYLADESDVSYYDWIYMYLELLYCTYNRGITDRQLSKFDLKIELVAIETLDALEPPRIDSNTAVVYIAYKDLAMSRICKAIVRRVYDETTGSFSLKGKYWSERKNSKKKICNA